MDRSLTWFANGWIGLILLANMAAIFGFFYIAPSFWAGIAKVWDIYSPFNVVNWIAEVVALAPAIGALIWRDRRRASSAA